VQDLGDLVLKLLVGSVGPLGGVGGELGPVEATVPTWTIPAAAPSLSEATRNPARAVSWRTRKRAMVT
jgi:hypothetical protein